VLAIIKQYGLMKEKRREEDEGEGVVKRLLNERTRRKSGQEKTKGRKHCITL